MKIAFLLLISLALVHAEYQMLLGKLFVGYQGWFGHPDDVSGLGTAHLKMHEGPFARDNCVIDFWPHTDQYERKYPAPQFGPGFNVFSAYDESTVKTHFRWMQENGIQGAFFQRFGVEVKDRNSALFRFKNRVFENVLNSAIATNRTWSLFYDLTGLGPGQIRSVMMEDYKYLKQRYNFINDGQYIRHKGKPLITIWGVGYADGRKYTLTECAQFLDFLKNGEFGGHSVMIGVPRFWREGGRDAVTGADLKILHNILLKADVVSPWAVGSYNTIEMARADARVNVKADQTWCTQNKLTLMPVIFPGFSWHNLQTGTQMPNPGPYNQIPRKQNGLYFLYEQGVEVTKLVRTIYVAMFDEMNQGTSVFKLMQNPPSLADGLRFVAVEEDPGFYLRMVDQIAKMLH